MIENILADHLLLSDSRLKRWLLRYSQNSGDGGAGGNSGSLVTKVQMEKKIWAENFGTTTPLVSRDIPNVTNNASAHQHLLLHQCHDRCILTLCCSSFCWNFGYYSYSCGQADGQRLESTGNRPEFFRSDRGSETMLLANVQLQFKQFEDPNATIDSCSRYGTSKSNS
jgi:hypothetical protein